MLLLPLPVLLLCAVRITLRWSDDCSYSCRFSLLTQACMMFCLISTPYGVFPYYTQKTPQLLLAWVCLDYILFLPLHLSIIHTSFFHIKRKSSIFQQLLMISKEIPCWLPSTTTAPSSELHTQHNTTLPLAGSAAAWLWNGTVYHFSSAAARHHTRPPASTPFFATRSFASLCLLLSTTEC